MTRITYIIRLARVRLARLIGTVDPTSGVELVDDEGNCLVDDEGNFLVAS